MTLPNPNALAYLENLDFDIAAVRQMAGSTQQSRDMRSLCKVVDALFNAVHSMNQPTNPPEPTS